MQIKSWTERMLPLFDAPTDGGAPAPEGDGKPAAPSQPAAPQPGETLLGAGAPADGAPAPEGEKAAPAAPSDPLDIVPVDGKYTVQVAEGLDLDTKLLDAVSPVFKELNLTPRQSQKLADAYANEQKARQEGYLQMVQGWGEQAAKDPEIGGANWDKSRTHAVSVVDRFGTPALKEFLSQSGGGNHPEVIRIFAKIGSVIGEDQPTGGGVASGKKDAASMLYPDDKAKG